MPSEFDSYVQDYKAIIDRGAALTGETFEYFIELRVDTLAGELAATGAGAPLRILDFGCGIGATEKILRDRFPAASIHRVDASAESGKAADSMGLRDGPFHFPKGEPLPFEDGAFDLVYSNGTFHHIDHGKHPAVFAELRRVLRPGGHLFVFEKNPLNPHPARAKVLRVLSEAAQPPPVERAVSSVGAPRRAVLCVGNQGSLIPRRPTFGRQYRTIRAGSPGMAR